MMTLDEQIAAFRKSLRSLPEHLRRSIAENYCRRLRLDVAAFLASL